MWNLIASEILKPARAFYCSAKFIFSALSVSCKTLVIGAATIGRGRKQTQKMFLSSADKPLSAVGTLTSLLCNSAKVVEKLFYRHPERSEGSTSLSSLHSFAMTIPASCREAHKRRFLNSK